jgi:hypothetical protein
MWNGLDRVDNTLGYTEANVVPCCQICNIAKQRMSVDEFVTWISKVHQHMVQSVEVLCGVI